MALIPFASNFLAGSLISLLMPVGLLIALVVWYMRSVTRVPGAEAERLEHHAPGTEPPAGAGGAQGGPTGGHP
jgi:hypothetical protein